MKIKLSQLKKLIREAVDEEQSDVQKANSILKTKIKNAIDEFGQNCASNSECVKKLASETGLEEKAIIELLKLACDPSKTQYYLQSVKSYAFGSCYKINHGGAARPTTKQEQGQKAIYDAIVSDKWNKFNKIVSILNKQGKDTSMLVQYVNDGSEMRKEEESDDYDSEEGSSIGMGAYDDYLDMAYEELEKLMD